MLFNQRDWESVQNHQARQFKCGYGGCGREISSEKGWYHINENGNQPDGMIYICPNCKRPTFFDLREGIQIPGVAIGSDIKNLPTEIQNIWTEIRNATSQGAYTAAVLAGRKLLMHVAVGQGAAQNLNFTDYVDYFVTNHYAPPNSQPWIDRIRQQGNEANHQVVIKNKDDATEIITFLEMLLRFIYEFPARAQAANSQSQTAV